MSQKYGVRMTLPGHNPLLAEHLLGDKFEAERWFDTKAARDQFLEDYQTPFIYFRRSDKATFNYELIEK